MAKTWGDGADQAPPPVQHDCQTARQLRPAEIDKLVEAYREGWNVQQLARRYNIHRSTVGLYLKAHGIDTKARALRPEQIAEATELYQAGATLEHLAKQYGLSDSTIQRYFREFGVKMRERGRRPHERSTSPNSR
ncbi:helix-turn-helix domain-containing protein [Lentzea sp. NBRC 102530]|uniref:helix-turn-helix domain-containing protein n=1 Tax=Lentzea sp. NBRC 102530 TaxID=3032201 RepID=UPI002554091F|nr:helix-turn-helix domain-containing protein [Lentzea sp. NBRC 102530]